MERFLVSSFDTYNQKFLGRSHKGFQQAEGELEQMLSQPMENQKQSTVGKNHLHKIIDTPDPIYFRFDDIIFYNDLTLISKQILIERIFENRWKLLTEKEIKFLGNKEDLLDKYLSYGNQLKNFRHIDNLIKQDLNLTLFKRIISDNS